MPRISSRTSDPATRLLVLLGAVTFVLGCPGFGSGELPQINTDADRPWCEVVEEILDARCTRCHGPTPRNGAPAGIRLDVFLDTTDSVGAVTLAPLIVAHARARTMPPVGEPEAPLSQPEVDALVGWVDAGAPVDPCIVDGSDVGFDTGVDVGIDAEDSGTDADVEDTRPEIPDIPVAAPTTEEVHTEVFARSCAGHHIDSGTQLPRLDLDGLEERLQSASVELPSMQWVTPGQPDESYLFHKVSGTHLDVGGSGLRMPIGPALTTAQLDLVRGWIEGLE